MAEPQLHPAHQLLARAHSPKTAATIFKEKVQHLPLILRPTSPDPTSKDARAARRRQRLRKKAWQLRKQKPKRMSAKERRRLGVHDIPEDPEMRKWELYVPLRDMWRDYMREILGIQLPPEGGDNPDEGTGGVEGVLRVGVDGGTRYVTGTSVGPKLASADYHGAELLVVRSNCVSRVGLRGIVLKDTKFTFEMVTPRNVVKTVPKKHTVFQFEIPRSRQEPPDLHQVEEGAVDTKLNAGLEPFVFELHGSQFEVRAADRANKKFKLRRLDDL